MAIRECTTISEVPNKAAVYALYARNAVIYVGQTRNLRTRIGQHLVAHDSSITIVSAPARLNPDRITEVRWWESDEFAKDGAALEAAELVAFEILNPILRSNANPGHEAKRLTEKHEFKRKMVALFNGQAAGNLRWRKNLILAEIDELKAEIKELKAEIKELKNRIDKLQSKP